MLLLEIIVIIAFISFVYFKGKQEAGKPRPGLSYVARPRLLSPAEERFWRVLSDACRDKYFLACQVRMADVLDARPYSQAAFNQISRKHFDFVLCDPATTRPLLVVELDDRSHSQSSAQARDAVKDAACRAAGLPLLRVPVQAQYDTKYLHKRIAETISAPTLDTPAKPGV